MKAGYKGQNSQLNYVQICKMTKSMNLMLELNALDLEAMGEDGGIGGDTTKDFFTIEEEDKIHKMLTEAQIFSNSREEEIVYRGEYRMLWEGFEKSKAEIFLKRNQFNYRIETPH